jgi:GTP-binding protein
MKITEAQFVISNTDYRKCPADGKPEYAFIGRSNVGKSSLINLLTNRKGLAMTSSRPGKTQLINHFLINSQWYIVDLPGYGYARYGKEGREQLRRIIDSYILNRTALTNLFLLLDCRHEPQKIDTDFIEWLGENQIPFSIVFTKTDKLSATRLETNIKNYEKRLLEHWEQLPPIFKTSALHHTGHEEILDYIELINRNLKNNLNNEQS